MSKSISIQEVRNLVSDWLAVQHQPVRSDVRYFLLTYMDFNMDFSYYYRLDMGYKNSFNCTWNAVINCYAGWRINTWSCWIIFVWSCKLVMQGHWLEPKLWFRNKTPEVELLKCVYEIHENKKVYGTCVEKLVIKDDFTRLGDISSMKSSRLCPLKFTIKPMVCFQFQWEEHHSACNAGDQYCY